MITTTAGIQEDWLVCPFRALDWSMMREVVTELFCIDQQEVPLIVPGSTLDQEDVRLEIEHAARSGKKPIVFFQDKLGGEISISGTPKSPEFSFDITLFEVVMQGEVMAVGDYGIWEIQTMDFHGSYKHAVKDLNDSLRVLGDDFHDILATKQEWPTNLIEGPNKSNVFKRTFYQMAFKFQISHLKECRGCVLSVPESVWESWGPHLGDPELFHTEGISYQLKPSTDYVLDPDSKACIYVFGPDPSSGKTPHPLRLSKKIYTDTESFTHFALKIAPEASVGSDGQANRIPQHILSRIQKYWSGFGTLFP